MALLALDWGLRLLLGKGLLLGRLRFRFACLDQTLLGCLGDSLLMDLGFAVLRLHDDWLGGKLLLTGLFSVLILHTCELVESVLSAFIRFLEISATLGLNTFKFALLDGCTILHHLKQI